MKFHEMTSGQLESIKHDQVLVILPIAAIEQHGPHLPTGTDTIICEAVATTVEQRNPQSVLLLPTLWLGASSHHLRFGATLTAELPTYIKLLCEIVQPLLLDGYRRVLLLNGHGGNIDPMKVALRQLQPEFPDTLLTAGCYWSPGDADIVKLLEGDDKFVGHACEFETSMIMHLRPELVDTDRVAHAGDWLPDQVQGMFVCRDMMQRTQAGATGRADLASAEKGAVLFDAAVCGVERFIEAMLAEKLPD
ncbi:MAG: creatininase family protein [Planctomycetaceae bacterium]|nr:creatininase family protein [Planctomycetales bacterium]MCB9939818.1 creatininase family protein [Planctomycetaceae bacterium]